MHSVPELAAAIQTCTFGAVVFALGSGKVSGISFNKQLTTEEKTRLYALAKQGRDAGLPPDWDTTKIALMREIVTAKFEQNPPLMALLKSTGQRTIVEASPVDSFWGDANNGRNELGKILMRVRDRILISDADDESEEGDSTDSEYDWRAAISGGAR